MRWRWWPTANEQAAVFAKSRKPVSDQDFLTDCGLSDDSNAWHVALAVRRSVASYGMVDSAYILAADRYPGELEALSGWDSLDFLGWILELENELCTPVSNSLTTSLREFSVKDLVNVVRQYQLSQSQVKPIDAASKV